MYQVRHLVYGTCRPLATYSPCGFSRGGERGTKVWIPTLPWNPDLLFAMSWAIRRTRRPRGEHNQKTYLGIKPGPFSFFTSITHVLLACRGSVMPNIVPEVILAGCMSFLACWINLRVWETPENLSYQGHAIVGVMLSFLVVFRSQIAWGMYSEGRAHIGTIVYGTRAVALEAVACLSAHQASIQEQLSPLMEKLVRRLANAMAHHLCSSAPEVLTAPRQPPAPSSGA